MRPDAPSELIALDDAPDLQLEPQTHTLPKLDYPLDPGVREGRLLTDPPWVRSLGRLELTVTTEGWKFPSPPAEYTAPAKPPTEPPADR